MRITERLVLYTAVATALGFSLASLSHSRVEPRAQAGMLVIDPDAPSKVATCDVFKAAKALMLTDRFSKPIDDKKAELQAGMTPLENELRALTDRLKALGPNAQGPDAEALAKEFQDKRAQYMKLGQDSDAAMNKFVVEKNVEADQQVLDSVTAIAERRGFTHVFTTRGLDEAKELATTSAFLQYILSRPLVKSPTDADLTADVMADLKLE